MIANCVDCNLPPASLVWSKGLICAQELLGLADGAILQHIQLPTHGSIR